MTPEQRREILKNALVKKTQKDSNWANLIEVSIEGEIADVINKWHEAAQHEHIGPKEAVSHFVELRRRIGEASFPYED